MKDETTSKQVNIQLPPKPEMTVEEGVAEAIVESETRMEELIDKRIGSIRPSTPKEPSAAPIVLGIALFLISVAGLLSVGLWYAWPSLQKYAETMRWIKPPAEPTAPPAVALHDTDDTAAIQKLIAPAAPKVTYYHVSCVAQLATGRINFHEFHYSLADGEPVNPLLLIHNLRHHAAQLTGSSNVIILAVSTLPGGAK